MARTELIYSPAKFSPSGSLPLTLCQFSVPSDLRGVLKAMRVSLFGVAGGVIPIEFDWATAADIGTMADGASSLLFAPPIPAHAKQMTARKFVAAQTEPTSPVHRSGFALHPQAQGVYVPLGRNNEWVIEPATFLGLRVISGTLVDMLIEGWLEE